MEFFFQEVNKIVYFSLGAPEKGKEKFPETTCLLFNKVLLLLLYMSVWEREIYICFFTVTALLVLSFKKNQFGE